ncbi:MAG: DUF1735 domain-containing protein [Prolixibacteraceae bacterium]|nr:DUF1735 domain-containing protein [Prolixibacteraceae bacterium]
MKKFLIILTLSAGLIACEENKFVDFDYSAGYFPNQYPVRTFDLSSNTNGNKFVVPIVMGGVYKNTQDRVFDIETAPALCNRALFESTKDTIHLMPSAYYTLGSTKLTIPAGKLDGSIEVQMNDAFFNDPLASRLRYVIPIRIKDATNMDSVLRGKSSLANPDPRVASQWAVVPKDYTMFAVKYINQYHGNYFHRGTSIVKDPTGKIVESNVYRTPSLVNNEVWSLLTTGKNQVGSNSVINSKLLPGNLMMNLSFGNDQTCTITQSAGSVIPVSGTGKFIKEGEESGGIKRNSIILSYKYSMQYTAPVLEGPIQTRDDNNPAISYTGTWSTSPEAANYGGDRHYSSTVGNYFTFNFTGDGIALYWKTGPSYGSFDVYLDNMTTPVAINVSTKTTVNQFQQKLYEVKGLAFKSHTIKVVIKEATNTIFDYLVYTVPQNALPSGTYTFEAQDTLVNKDRVVTFENYTPLIY